MNPLSPFESPYQAKEISCPLCGAEDYTPVIPSRKKGAGTRCAAAQTRFWQSVCDHCGLIYENPTVDVTSDRNYNETHYYDLIGFPPHLAHLHQTITAEFRYDCLKSRVDFASLSKVLDVGSVGSWPAFVAERFPQLESHLLEPSQTAIDFARHSFPAVHCHHAMVEEADFADGSFDVISFFHSLYAISQPLSALRQCRRFLRPDGRLVIAISLLSMELEIRKNFGRRQWLGLDALARTIALVTYSRRTLRAAVEAAGFAVEETFISRDDNPGSPNCGREDYYMLCRPNPEAELLEVQGGRDSAGRSSGASVPSTGEHAVPQVERNSEEAAWAKRFLRSTTAAATRTVLKAILEDRPADELLLVYDDPRYRDALLAQLRELGTQATVRTLAGSFVPSLKEAAILDSESVLLLNASGRHLHPQEEGYTKLRVFNGIQDFFVEGDYAYCVSGPSGEAIMATLFDPPELESIRAYPFSPNEVEVHRSSTAFDLAKLEVPHDSLPKGFAKAFEAVHELRGIKHSSGFAYVAPLGEHRCLGDLPRLPRNSPYVLLEDGIPLVLAHSAAQEVSEFGRGRYRHEGGTLLFSSSDGSSPLENGRRYAIAKERR